MAAVSTWFRGVIKVKTLCVGGHFAQAVDRAPHTQFPASVLTHTDDFEFEAADSYDEALQRLTVEPDFDLVFVDADYDSLSEITLFIGRTREIRPQLPVVVFTSGLDDKMRYLLRAGAAWHLTKYSAAIGHLAEHMHQHVFRDVDWEQVFRYYARDNTVKPRLESGFTATSHEVVDGSLEEQYIIKRLFANSEVVQLFHMDVGFSGSRIYTIKPAHQSKRILKIDAAHKLEAVREKHERLIQPRLSRRVGQIQSRLVRGQHLAGACYILAGSEHDATTLTKWMQDQNRVRKALIDRIFEQLRGSLDQLYAGGSEAELRYWAPLYARVLPTQLTLEDATLVGWEREDADFVLSLDELTTLSAVPGNRTLRAIDVAVRRGEHPVVILHGFEVSELNTQHGILYLHDDLLTRFPIWPLIGGREHPILRFKVRLVEEEWEVLTHPAFRHGKRISVRGRVASTQESIIAANIEALTGRPYEYESESLEFASGRFLAPVKNLISLLWHIGREDMITPNPQLAPVIHGDLNTSNILVGAKEDVPVWLIDFSEARPGHIYFDLAKLEVEFRTHVLCHLFNEMVSTGVWDSETATQFALLVEHELLHAPEIEFEAFVKTVRNCRTEWYDSLYAHFPLYSENLLYFLYRLRQIASSYGPQHFQRHYPAALFCHSLAVLKHEALDQSPWHPWAKRLALCAALVAGKQAIQEAERPRDVMAVLNVLRQRSAFALITVGEGEERKYLLQWNTNWGMFNLIGGKMDNSRGDGDSFARTIQREMMEELGLNSPRDYRIVREYQPIQTRQFSRREFVHKDYVFHVFQIEFSPRHPKTQEEYAWFSQRLSQHRENILVSRGEIERLRTVNNRPISDTTRMILQKLGEIEGFEYEEIYATLGVRLDASKLPVIRGQAMLTGWLVNPPFGSLIENVSLEILPSPELEVDSESAVIHVESLPAGQEVPLSIPLYPQAEQATITIRVTYYDVRGQEYRQFLDGVLHFETESATPIQIENPYVIDKPLAPTPDALFYGRDDLFDWLEENLQGETPRALILHGQRLIGKTSALYQLVGGQHGRPLRQHPNEPIFPIYFNLERMVGRDVHEFLNGLAQHMSRNLTRWGIKMAPPALSSANGSAFRAFDSFLDEVERKLPEQGLLVLILDELDKLGASFEHGRLDGEFLTYLHSLIQARLRLRFILSGSNDLLEGAWRPLFDTGIGREVFPLSRQDTERLIRKPVASAVRFHDLAVDRIWLATRGHPFYSQLVCHRLVESLIRNGREGRKVTMAEVGEVIGRVIREDDRHLQPLWRESSREEQLVMAALAGSQGSRESSVARSEISARLRGTSLTEADIDQAIRRLALRRLIEPVVLSPSSNGTIHRYALSFDLLRLWMAQKHPLTALLP
ncbi:MAG: NUDIX domain-containing protein [Anaerolineae bacterium]